jgi:hypothetical protein
MQHIREEDLGNGKRIEIDQRSSHVNRGFATVEGLIKLGVGEGSIFPRIH